jgi:hypothetical protein
MFERFNKFAAILAQNLQGFGVKFKDESTLMKIIGWLLFFNKAFMTRFVTTIGKTVYWPNKEKFEERKDVGILVTLAHEYQHVKDAQKITSFLFSILYLFPQILALPGVLLTIAGLVWIPLMAFGVISWSWWLLPFLLTLIFIAPIPAPWRKHYELKGYIMSLFMANEYYKEREFSDELRLDLLKSQIEMKNEQFVGPGYYFMWPFGVEKDLEKAIGEIMSGEILKRDAIYPEMAKAFKDSK